MKIKHEKSLEGKEKMDLKDKVTRSKIKTKVIENKVIHIKLSRTVTVILPGG